MKTLSKLLILTALTGLCVASGHAQSDITVSEPAGSTDDIPPLPVANIKAIDTPDDGGGGSITLTWDLSADDEVSFTPFGNTFVPRGGVQGYRIYRQSGGGEEALIATVGPGVAEYVDRAVESSISYIYTIRPFDQDNETDPQIESGSGEDLARIARAIDNIIQPIGLDGTPVLGWFSRLGDEVGFSDFFLFADHFGLQERDTGFDPLFDIVPDGRIDYSDFFRFADDFGKVIANADEVRNR